MYFNKLFVTPLIALAVAMTLGACNSDHGSHDHGSHDHGSHDHGSHEDRGSDASDDTDDGYPLNTCVVSGEELGGMGETVVINHKGTTVKLCCDSCVDDFNAEPDKYLAMLTKQP